RGGRASAGAVRDDDFAWQRAFHALRRAGLARHAETRPHAHAGRRERLAEPAVGARRVARLMGAKLGAEMAGAGPAHEHASRREAWADVAPDERRVARVRIRLTVAGTDGGPLGARARDRSLGANAGVVHRAAIVRGVVAILVAVTRRRVDRA